MTSLTLPVNVSYAQYHVQGLDADLGEPEYVGGNGLVWVNQRGDAAVVMTGVNDGDLAATVGVLDSGPDADLAAWDDVVEVSMAITGSELWIIGPMDTESTSRVALPAASGETRPYRVRVHARGRDRGREVMYVDADAGEEIVEQHMILIWPAPTAPEIRWKLTDAVGAETRAGG